MKPNRENKTDQEYILELEQYIQKITALTHDINLPFKSVEFVQVWVALLAEKKWKKKSKQALNLACKFLSHYQEWQAIQIVEAAIIGEWQGLHEVKFIRPQVQAGVKLKTSYSV